MAIPQGRSRSESGQSFEQRVDLQTLLVQPWCASVTYEDPARRLVVEMVNPEDVRAFIDPAPHSDKINKVMVEVRNIWSRHGVYLRANEPIEVNLAQYERWDKKEAKRPNFLNLAHEFCREYKNLKIHAERHLDILFVNIFGQWGISFKDAIKEELHRPLAIVAVEGLESEGQKYTQRETKVDFYKDDENDQGESITLSDYYPNITPISLIEAYGLILDTAHEIGHLLGLNHFLTDRMKWGEKYINLEAYQIQGLRFFNLMSSSLYNPKGSSIARELLYLLKNKYLVITDQEQKCILHGAALNEPQKDIVRDTINKIYDLYGYYK